ncbi:MAG: Crp/Fnr family transcriptional regulator [Oscillospiraceae bacterium]
MGTEILQYISTISISALFKGVCERELIRLLDLIGASLESCDEGGFFIMQGDEQPDIFVIVSGGAVGERAAENGKTVTINEFGEGDEFGDLLSGSDEHSPVSVRAHGRCLVLRFSFERLLAPCAGCEVARNSVVRNLVAEASRKYFALNRRLALLLNPSLRGRIAVYLLEQSARSGEDCFSVEHDREGQSRYLGCDRSALSRELSRMKKEGIIEYHKNHFEIRLRLELELIAL